MIVNELKSFLNKKYDITLSEQEVNDILKIKEFSIYGQKKDLSVKINSIMKDFFIQLYHHLNQIMGKY